MEVKIGDQAITTLPFSLKEDKSSDPYSPKKTFVREGPWRELAYFSSPIDKPDVPIEFNWWMSLREVPPGVKRPMCTVHVIQAARRLRQPDRRSCQTMSTGSSSRPSWCNRRARACNG